MFLQLWLRRINKVLICKKEGVSWRYPQRILKAPDKMNSNDVIITHDYGKAHVCCHRVSVNV
ncbi:hypothetical protein P5673_030080 [Acropora cervicornis]|uniref:Uncharacterized protein n=1 Tax=Acropora cervicornis TaxID=6130 RepID=A0AAD9UTJ7_ACRCE|nr:hypothetical protein P5673_030080 [Acropora cervicornis]